VYTATSPITTVTSYTGTFSPNTTVTAYFTSISCINKFTNLLTLWPYLYYLTSTDTYTPAITITTTTLSKTITLVTLLLATLPDQTTTVSGTSYVVSSTVTTTTVNYLTTLTTTLDAKYAPTNLISSINNTDGIFEVENRPGSASTYALVEDGLDASLCC
jgi:hypothetical protein